MEQPTRLELAINLKTAKALGLTIFQSILLRAERSSGEALATSVAALALRHGLATISSVDEFTAAGGLLSYGASLSDTFRRVAIYVDKILKGARPSELPVEQPTKFKLAVNLRTAKALGLTVPESILTRADEVVR